MIYVNSTDMFKLLQYSYLILHSFRHNVLLILCKLLINDFEKYFFTQNSKMDILKESAKNRLENRKIDWRLGK